MAGFIDRIKRILSGGVKPVNGSPAQPVVPAVLSVPVPAPVVERKFFDHEATCRQIVENWIEIGVQVKTLTPEDVFFSGQESVEPGPISLDDKIRSLDAGVWLSRELMYASCYTDFSSTVGQDEIRSKALFKTRPAFDINVVIFADGAPHPAPKHVRINGVNSDLYIAQQWPRLLLELCRIRPEFIGVCGHLRECDRFTSELWLHETNVLTIDHVLDVSRQKHWDRVEMYGVGNAESERNAIAGLFEVRPELVQANNVPRNVVDNEPAILGRAMR